MTNNDELAMQAEQCANILENISGFEPDDIDGDAVDLRFDLDGMDTGCTVSLVEQCQHASDALRALLAERDADKNRIAELEAWQETLRPVGVMSEKAFYRLERSESRFIALWPRPGIHLPRKRPDDGLIVYARTAAGIKLEVEKV